MSDGGPVAPDGCPIAVYLAIPGDDEAALVHGAIPPSTSILELGCGVGRMTRHLVALGHAVTGVDNSDDMLAHAARLPGVETLKADIATLDLAPRTWPVVRLATMIYEVDGCTYRQPFVASEVDDDRLAAMAAATGLRIEAFVGFSGPVENPTSVMVVDGDGRERGPVYRVVDGPPQQATPQSVSFVSRDRGWLVDGGFSTGSHILATTDGGRTWTVEYRAPSP